jgi:peptidoglycan/xylan/chitin deacetylase (PgdA/CDA1 family)
MRSPKYWAKDLIYGACWFMAGRRYHGVRAILLYHSVGSIVPLSVSRRDFERQVAYLKDHFYIVRVRDLPKDLAKVKANWPIACITFDDGLLDNYEYALSVLENYNVKATFFITTGSIGKTHRTFYGEQPCMNAAQLREVASLGHEIGAHTITHPKLTRVTPQLAWQEIVGSKIALEDILGEAVLSFAYPKGDYNESVKGMVREAGFWFAPTTWEGLLDNAIDGLALPRISINPTMGWIQFRGKLSPGLEFYEGLRGRR